MIITHFIKPSLLSTRHKLQIAVLSSFRQLCQYDINRTNKADVRMSANVFRQKTIFKATVHNIYDASPSIKIVQLLVKEPKFSFKAGQWVDFYIPGIEEITGYSMTSGPHKVIEDGTLDLAVKYGKFAPTHWIHTQCNKGTLIEIKVGGDFCYGPQPDTIDATSDLLLIGGGVGVNPLVSILSEYCHLKTANNQHRTTNQAYLLYSAKAEADLIFKEAFTKMEEEVSSFKSEYFVTGLGSKTADPKIKYHRIEEPDIKTALEKLKTGETLCYICGPSNMTDDIVNILLKLGVKSNFIRYEKWW